MAQSVERVLGKDEVTSSNLVSSSRNHSKRFAYCGFLFCGDLVPSGGLGESAGKAGASPMFHWPGSPKTQRVFGVDRVTGSNLVSSSRNHSKRFAYCGFLFCGDLALSPQVRRGLGRSPMLFPPGKVRCSYKNAERAVPLGTAPFSISSVSCPGSALPPGRRRAGPGRRGTHI